MKRAFVATVVLALATSGPAMAQNTKIDLKTLPATIKSLDWKSVDWNATPRLEQARALILLNDVLNEMGSQMAADADLMSQYVDEQDLGERFVAEAPVEDKHLTQEEAQRVAVAMLRGPMAGSTYATGLSNVAETDLPAYMTLYTSTSNREWASAVESRQQMKSLARFLESSGKMAAFKEWAPGEVERRQKEHDAEVAQKRAAALEQQKQQQEVRKQAANERKEQEQKQREQERKDQEQASLQMQQAMCAAQGNQNATLATGDTTAYPDWYYGGLGYAATAGWYRDQAYRGAAVARTENRMTGWRGGRGGSRGGGRR